VGTFRRKLFTALSAVSLLLCIAIVLTWVHSHWYQDSLLRADGGSKHLRVITVISYNGNVIACFSKQDVTGNDSLDPEMHGTPVNASAFGWKLSIHKLETWPDWFPGQPERGPAPGFHGFDYTHLLSSMRDVTADEHSLSVPHWFLVLLTALLPAWWTFALWRRCRYRRDHSLCQHCGYDLRATPERCPECGIAVATQTPQEIAA
jgi:hypothetical protein